MVQQTLNSIAILRKNEPAHDSEDYGSSRSSGVRTEPNQREGWATCGRARAAEAGSGLSVKLPV